MNNIFLLIIVFIIIKIFSLFLSEKETFYENINDLINTGKNKLITEINNKNNIIKENKLTITGFNDENKDLVITGLTQINKI